MNMTDAVLQGLIVMLKADEIDGISEAIEQINKTTRPRKELINPLTLVISDFVDTTRFSHGQLYRRPESEVRVIVSVIETLARYGGEAKEAIPVLIGACQNHYIRTYALAALEKISGQQKD